LVAGRERPECGGGGLLYLSSEERGRGAVNVEPRRKEGVLGSTAYHKPHFNGKTGESGCCLREKKGGKRKGKEGNMDK